MNFGVTDKLSEYYLKNLCGKNTTAGQNGISDFAEQLAAAKSAAASGVQSSKSNNTETAYYMGKPYEEALRKITDPVAASAFQQAYALKMAGGTDYISSISKTYSTGKVGATSFEDAFSYYDVITHVGNADIPSWKWQRNDFPFWKYFQKNTSADALNDWEPKGENPSQLRSDLQRNYSSIGAGKIAILMPDSLKEKMDADPVYAQQIVAKLQAWKEDYDRWNNLAAASYGYNVAEHQASLSYVFNLDENGDVKNCTVTGSGGTITGPSKEEQEQFEREQAAKRKRMLEHTKMLEESSLKRAQEEKEAIISSAAPLYVCELCPQSGDVVLGNNEDLFGKEADVADFNWISGSAPQSEFRCKAKIRYRQQEQQCTIIPTGENTVHIVFDKPQRAITPGQAAVLYDGDIVLGGGTIK